MPREARVRRCEPLGAREPTGVVVDPPQLARHEVGGEQAEGRVALDDLVAQRAQQVAPSPRTRPADLVVTAGLGAGGLADSAMRSRPAAGAGSANGLRRRAAYGRRPAAAGDHVEAERRVHHACAWKPSTLSPYQCSASGTERDTAALGLEPEQAAVGRGDAGWSRRRPRRCAAPARPAATAAAEPPLEPPGVRSVSHGLRVMPQAARLGEGPRWPARTGGSCRSPPRRPPAAGARSRRPAWPAARGPRVPCGGDLAGHVRLSFTATGTPSSGRSSPPAAPGVGLVGLGQRPLGHHHAEGVQLGVEPRDALQVELDQLARGHLAGADQLGLARDARECEVGASIAPAPPSPRPSRRCPRRGPRSPCPRWW